MSQPGAPRDGQLLLPHHEGAGEGESQLPPLPALEEALNKRLECLQPSPGRG